MSQFINIQDGGDELMSTKRPRAFDTEELYKNECDYYLHQGKRELMIGIAYIHEQNAAEQSPNFLHTVRFK